MYVDHVTCVYFIKSFKGTKRELPTRGTDSSSEEGRSNSPTNSAQASHALKSVSNNETILRKITPCVVTRDVRQLDNSKELDALRKWLSRTISFPIEKRS